MTNQASLRRGTTALLTVSALLVTACGSSNTGSGSSGGTSGAAIRVGVLFDQSKTYKFIGQPALAGLQSFVSALNAKGGVNGHKITLDIQDDRSDAATARTAYSQFAANGDVVVVGPAASATLVPIAPLAAQDKLPDLTLAAVATYHRPAQPYLFAGGLYVGDSAGIDAAWMAQVAAGKSISSPKVAALSLDTPAVQDFRDALVKFVPSVAHGTLVRNDVVAVTATDMSSAVIPIASVSPDFIPVGLLPTQVPGALSSLRSRGVNAPMINYFVGSDQATFAGANDTGYYAVRQYAEPTETGVAGLDQMKADAQSAGQTSQMTSAWFTYGYVQGELVAEALKNCADACDGTKMRAALEGITNFTTNGLSGTLGVSSTDHMFVKQGRVFGWDATSKTSVPQGQWISAPK